MIQARTNPFLEKSEWDKKPVQIVEYHHNRQQNRNFTGIFAPYPPPIPPDDEERLRRKNRERFPEAEI
jgi:hypothetical protein